MVLYSPLVSLIVDNLSTKYWCVHTISEDGNRVESVKILLPFEDKFALAAGHNISIDYSLLLQPDQCTTCQKELNATEMKHHCRNCGQISCADCCNNHIVLEDLGYFSPVRVCGSCFESRQTVTGRQLTFSRTSSEVCRSVPPTEDPAKNGGETAFDLLNALKSASVADAESKANCLKGETS